MIRMIRAWDEQNEERVLGRLRGSQVTDLPVDENRAVANAQTVAERLGLLGGLAQRIGLEGVDVQLALRRAATEDDQRVLLEIDVSPWQCVLDQLDRPGLVAASQKLRE